MSIDELVRMDGESDLMETLKDDIDGTEKDTITFQAGHFPVNYVEADDAADHKLDAEPAFDEWGPFSKYTAELAARLAAYANDQGKEVKFIFLADDHGASSNPSSEKSARKRLYQKKSGQEAQVDSELRDILASEGFDEEYVVRHDQGKRGRRSSLYFSETKLQHPESEARIDEDTAAELEEIEDGCAKGYTALLESDYFDASEEYLISFIPDICDGNVCNRALDGHVTEDVSGSHVFMTTEREALSMSDVDDLYEGSIGEGDIDGMHKGVRYRKD